MNIHYCYIHELPTDKGSIMVAFSRNLAWNSQRKQALIEWINKNAPHIGVPIFDHSMEYSDIEFKDNTVSIYDDHNGTIGIRRIAYYIRTLVTYDVICSDNVYELRLISNPLTKVPYVFKPHERDRFSCVENYQKSIFQPIREYDEIQHILHNLRDLLPYLINRGNVTVKFSNIIDHPVITITNPDTDTVEHLEAVYERVNVYFKTIKALHPDWMSVIQEQTEFMTLLLPNERV